MKYKVFTKAMKVLIVGTLIIMAFTKGNITDWLIIGLTAGWLIFMTAYLINKSGKREPLDDLHAEDSDEEDFGEDTENSNDILDPLPDPSEAEIWYRMIGCQILTEAIIDLNTRGIKKLEIKENGDVIVADSKFETINTLPDKSCWDRIVELLREDGLTASAGRDEIQISW
jgi:hypothetical protein